MIIFDDISDEPVTKEQMAQLKVMLDKHPCKASVFQGPRHKGDIFEALREIGNTEVFLALSQPRGGTDDKPGVPRHGGNDG